MASLLFNPNDQYRTDAGVVCAGGSLTFTITGTSTAKNVFAELALSTNLGNVITLDAAGRPSTAIWLASDVLYRVVLKDSAAVQVWSRDSIGNAAAAGLVPLNPASGTSGQVYTTDGVAALWATPRYVPDPTGHSGKRIGTDGSLVFWEAQSSYSDTSLPGGILQDSTSFTVGKFKVQTGSGSAATNGTQTVTAAVTFGTAYTTLLHVDITPSVGAVTGEGGGVELSATGRSVTGFTATFIAPDMGAVPGTEAVTSAVTFTWVAYGLIA